MNDKPRMPESCVIHIDNAIHGHHGNGKKLNIEDK